MITKCFDRIANTLIKRGVKYNHICLLSIILLIIGALTFIKLMIIISCIVSIIGYFLFPIYNRLFEHEHRLRLK